MLSLPPTEIIMRDSPCKCGCGGRDPWHARTFIRAIHDIKPANIPSETYDGIVKDFYHTGIAKFPWGEETVIEVGIGTTKSASRSVWWELLKN